MYSKKLICLVLLLAMCLALAACAAEEAPEPVRSVEPSPVQEYVYAAEYVKINVPEDSYLTVRDSNEDGFYVTITEVVEEEAPGGISPRYEGEYDVYGTFLYFVDYNGNVKKVKSYSSMPPRENTEGLQDLASSSSVSGMSFTDEGFVSIEQVYSSWQEGGNAVPYSQQYWENQKFEQKYYIRHFDLKGNELSCAEIDFDIDKDAWLDAYRMKLDDNGNALVGSKEGIKAIAPDGSTAYTISFEGYLDGILRMPDGSLSALIFSEGSGGYRLYAIDCEKGSLAQGTDVNFDAYSSVSGKGEYDLGYSNGYNFYGYSLGEDEPEKLFSWLGLDVNGSKLSLIGVSSDGVVSGLVNNWDVQTEKNNYELVRVSEVPAEQMPEKQLITMGSISQPYDIQDMIVDFNRSSEKYRVEFIDYSVQTRGDWEAAAELLEKDIIGGNAPDIICLDGLNCDKLAFQGLLEDLYPWIDKDKELDRKDFFPNVLEAFQSGDKLCTTVSGIYISTVLGPASVVGDEYGWSYDEFYAALAKMPAGCTAFDEYVTRDSILHSCLALDMDLFVDWESGECSFDSEQFVELLEFAKSFPEEFDWDNYDWENALSTEDRLARGKQMLIQASAYTVEDLFYNSNTSFLGEDVSYVGYPSSHGSGNMLQQSDSGYAMSSSCENKDAAWQFLREFFTEEHHRKLYSLSSRIDVFEDMAKNATTVYYEKDEEGKEILDEEGQPVPIVRFNMWDVKQKKSVEIYALTQEQMDQVRSLLKSCSKAGDYNNDILDIVTQQASSFFEGKRSATETAQLIQIKVSAYMQQEK